MEESAGPELQEGRAKEETERAAESPSHSCKTYPHFPNAENVPFRRLACQPIALQTRELVFLLLYHDANLAARFYPVFPCPLVSPRTKPRYLSCFVIDRPMRCLERRTRPENDFPIR